MHRDLWQAYVAMIGAMEAAGYPYQADNYALWRAFIGFGEGYLEYVHPDRYGWAPHERPLYDRLKTTTDTYRSLRSDFQRLGLAVPTFGLSLMRDAGTVRMVPTRQWWAL